MRTLQIDISEESEIPKKAITSSAAYDFTGKTAVIPAHGVAAVTLNVRVAIPATHFLLLLSRSSLAMKGVTTLAGVVDSDYQGPVIALLANSTDKDFIIKEGQRVCQGMFVRKYEAQFNKQHELTHTDHGDDGFGSSGL